MGYRSNIEQVTARMEREIPRAISHRIASLVAKLIMEIDISVHDKTPVWSGLAVRNMIWTKDSPNTSEFPEIESGEVTDEGRRGANQAAARQTRDNMMRQARRNPFAVWYLSNASHHIFDLEAGKLPSPDRSRVPAGGMFGLTYAQVRAGM